MLTGSWCEPVECILAEIGSKMEILAKLALLLFLPGFAAAQYSVSLSWTASTSANVTGYRIYRGTTSGGPYSLPISSLVAGTSYTDTAVQAGRTYYYVATAVDVGNRESGYSNETQAVVPSVAIGITTLVCSPVSIGAPGVSTCTGTLPALGQAPRVSTVTKAPGEKVTLTISVDSQPGKAPVALKWEVIFPVQLMEMEGDAPEIGSAAMNSGKSLQCTARNPYSYVCLLSGGQNPIADGPIAIFGFRIRTTAQAGTTALRIERAEATTVDSKALTLNNTESIVIIR